MEPLYAWNRLTLSSQIVRDIFTFGLGEVGDWRGLNEAINYADSLIKSANANLASCQEGLAHAQASVNAINEELNRFTQLKHSLDGFGPVLQSQASSMEEKLCSPTRELYA